MGRLSVLLTTQDTYPYTRGGVSTWCNALAKELPDVDFALLAFTRDSYVEPQYALPANVRGMVTVPLGGTVDPAEYGADEPFLEYLRRRWSMTRNDVKQDYLPAFTAFVSQAVQPTEPARKLGLPLLQMHLHYSHYDYTRTHGEPAVWAAFTSIVQRAWSEAYPSQPAPGARELGEAWRELLRVLLPLSVDAPRVDVTHSSAAAACGLPCIIAKLRWQTPYLLTEHGVYLREGYLNAGRSGTSLFLRWFTFRLINTIVDVNYAFADQIAPVCSYNAKWETWRGVAEERISVIHNGVNPDTFGPAVKTERTNPVVVCLAAIHPLKGSLDLIEAAGVLRDTAPGVEFRFHGPVADEAYFTRCQERVAALELQKTVLFCGPTAEAGAVLQQADIVAVPSVSEGFPYAVLEAMMTEAAIVATDVGGVREALGNTGMLVEPSNPAAMAAALSVLLASAERRLSLGQSARERAVEWFTERRFAAAYLQAYDALVTPASELPATDPLQWIEPDIEEPAIA